MDVVFAAIGGPDIAREELAGAVAGLAGRADFEEVEAGADLPVVLRVRRPWTGERGVWSAVDLMGEDSISTLVHAARSIAAQLGKPVRAVASGVERQLRGGAVEIGYRVFEVQPDGASRPVAIALADEECRRVTDDPPTDELGGLFALLLDDEPAESEGSLAAAGPGRSFGRRKLFDDPRLARLAATMLAAKTVSFAPDPSGRIRLKIDSSDGGKQISFVSVDEAESLQQVTKLA